MGKMVGQHVGRAVETRSFGARDERIETGVLVKSKKGRFVSVERRSGECNQWKEKDSVQEETLVVSLMEKPRETDAVTDTDPIPVIDHNHPLPLLTRRLRLRESLGVFRAESFWIEKVKHRVKKTLEERAQNRHVIYGILPYP